MNRIQVQTNAYEITWEPTPRSSGEVAQYDIIEPLWDLKRRPDGSQDIGKSKGMELMMRLQQSVAPDVFNPLGAYDGKKNMYATVQYSFGASGSWIVPWDATPRSSSSKRQPRQVKITVNFTKTVSMRNVKALTQSSGGNRNMNEAHLQDAIESLTMLNLFFQSVPRTGEGVYTTKSFFTAQNRKPLRGQALEIWRGFFQSVRPAKNRLIVNVDVTQGVILPARPLLDLVMTHMNFRDLKDLYRLDERGLTKLKAFLRGIKVDVNVGRRGRPKVIKGVVADVGSHVFQKDGEEVTVGDHFHRVHNKRIPPGEPGVKLGNDGLFPLQVCTTVLQIYKRTNMPDIVRESLAFSPPNPSARLEAIKAGWQVLAYHQSPVLMQAGISVNPRLMEVSGQLLTPPKIGFGERVETGQQRAGQWDVMGKPLLQPGQAHSWIVLDFTNSQPRTISTFVADLWQAMIDRKIKIPRVQPDMIIKASPNRAREEIVTHYRRFKPELIVAILPENSAPVYNTVKRYGDIIEGIVTQCVKWSRKLEENAMKRGGAINQYHNNLILKMNVKLGGNNWLPHTAAMEWLLKEPTMLLGADVSHPGPGSQLPSVASLVGSLDNQLLRYGASVRIQSARTEMIADIAVMFEGLLRSFFQRNHTLPTRLLMYRDGVSEGEFIKVKDQELSAMAGVISRAYGSDQSKWPKIAFIVVGKRHHFRFFPNRQQADPRGNDNLPAGFVTSDGINHPIYEDFYLQSQAGLKGTSRPSHYTILTNGLGIDIEKIQHISFALCHCYSRSTRSVKVPAPVYYADLVCRRAKFHFEDGVEFDDSASIVSEDNHLSFYQSRWNDINDKLKTEMYFV